MSATFTKNLDGTYSPINNPVNDLHTLLLAAGAQIPTALAVPAVAALSPTAFNSVLSMASDVAAGNYISAATTGIPLLIGAVTALYATFSKTKTGPTDEEIHASVSRMSHDDLIKLLTPITDLQANTAI